MVWDSPMWSEMVQDSLKLYKAIWNGPRWSEMVQDGLKWSKVVQVPKTVKDTWDILKKYTFCIHTAWAPKARRLAAKKGNAQPSSPFLWFNLFSLFFSFLCVQIFPYGQVDSLFQMDHGAISPSLMVLFVTIYSSFVNWNRVDICHDRYDQSSC